MNLVRSFSTQTSGLVRPPVQFYGVAGQYVNALYSAAAKTKKLDQVEKDLANLNDAFDKDNKFRQFLVDPLIDTTQKKTILNQICKDKIKTSDLTQNVLNVMAENRRLSLLPNVAKNFKSIMSIIRGELDCTVYTAEPVTDGATRKEIEETLKKFTNKKLTIFMKVDPSIVGGMVVDFGGQHYIDLSLRSKLKIYTDIVRQEC